MFLSRLTYPISMDEMKAKPVTKDDFFRIGATESTEPLTWKWFFNGIGKFIYWFLVYPEGMINENRHRIMNETKGVHTQINISELERQMKQDDLTNEEEDEMMDFESGFDPD